MAAVAHYDDPQFSYVSYWHGRDYEHSSEVMALSKLLSDTHVSAAADIGGGYGRLSEWLQTKADTVTLVEPSQKQLDIAAKNPRLAKVKRIKAFSDATKLPESSQDIVIIVRVSHHLPDLIPTISELYRIIKPNGLLVFEIANSINFKSRFKNWLTGKKAHKTPIERRSAANIQRHTIEFVNHHPEEVIKLIARHGFLVTQHLSVSNFRSPTVKKIIPMKALFILEKLLQRPLAFCYFGPSIFVLARKAPTST